MTRHHLLVFFATIPNVLSIALSHNSPATAAGAPVLSNCINFGIFGWPRNGIALYGYAWGKCFDNSTQPASCSTLHINRCYNNMDGVLVPANGDGTFAQTCHGCTLDISKSATSRWLKCTCLTTADHGLARNVTAEVDLNQHLFVRNNMLQCPGALGDPAPGC